MRNALASYAGRSPRNRKAEGPAHTLRPLNSIGTLPSLDTTTAADVQRFELWLLAAVGDWRNTRHREARKGVQHG